MKKVIFIALLFISTLSFSQTDDKFVGFPFGAQAPEKPTWYIPSPEQTKELDLLIREFESSGQNTDRARCHITKKLTSPDGCIMWTFNCNGTTYYVTYTNGQYYVSIPSHIEGQPTIPIPC